MMRGEKKKITKVEKGALTYWRNVVLYFAEKMESTQYFLEGKKGTSVLGEGLKPFEGCQL